MPDRRTKHRRSTQRRAVFVPVYLRRNCMQTWRHPENRKYITYYIVVREGSTESKALAMCTENLAKFWHVVFNKYFVKYSSSAVNNVQLTNGTSEQYHSRVVFWKCILRCNAATTQLSFSSRRRQRQRVTACDMVLCNNFINPIIYAATDHILGLIIIIIICKSLFTEIRQRHRNNTAQA